MSYGFNSDKTKADINKIIRPVAYNAIGLTSKGGRNLTEVFASEIENFTSEWAWIKDRIRKNNYDGIYIGDYIPLEIDRTTYPYSHEYHNMRIAFIEGNYMSRRIQDKQYPAWNNTRAYFVSDGVMWTYNLTETGTNNGNAENPNPFACSSLKAFLNDSVFNELPEELQNVITERFLVCAPKRYAQGQTLTDENGVWAYEYNIEPSYISIGKLWVPFEVEIFGTGVLGNGTYGCAGMQQFPLFKELSNRMMCEASYTPKDSFHNYPWWTASAVAGSSTEWVKISERGAPIRGANRCSYAPLCFMIGY